MRLPHRSAWILVLFAVLLAGSTVWAGWAIRVVSVTLCEDVEGSDFVPVNITTRFTTDAPAIHAVVRLEDVETASRVKGTFISVDAISTPNYEIDGTELEVRPGAATAHFSLSRPDQGWPPGNYKLNVSIDGKLAAVAKFTIVARQEQRPAANPLMPRAQTPPAALPAPSAVPAAIGFSGTYSMQGQGVTLSLVLRQDATGGIAGTLSSSAGTKFQLEGQVEEGVAMGLCQGGGIRVYFQAELQGQQLALALIEINPTTNMPDYERARMLQFNREGTAPTPPAGPSARPSDPAPFSNPREGAPANAPAAAGTPGAMAASPNEVSDPGWGFGFTAPPGWTVKHDQGGAILGHNTIAGVILVIPHMAGQHQEVQQQLMQGLTDDDTQLRLTGQLRQISPTAMAGDYQGVSQNQQVKARGIGTFSPHGGGAYILAVSTPEQFGEPLAAAAETIARQMRYFKPQVSELVQYFAGMWAHVTPNTLTNLNLYPDGTYDDVYEASYSGTDPGTGVTDWGLARRDKARGRWTARGTREQGVIILTKPDGTQIEMQYQVHRERGETYWREYYFNGKLYGKRR